MNAERWARVKAIFDEAVAVSPSDRPGLVRERCRGDATLQADVDSLLAADLARGDRLEAPLASALLHASPAPAGRPDVLMPGSQFGSYRITGFLDAGGMGEVYRAQDPALGREVAIKVLPGRWTDDPERRARLEREARLLAALNHPNIGGIYGIEEERDARGLVLELIEGQTLAERIAKRTGRSGAPRGLRVTEALNIAVQIAAALEFAHGRGIVHRDLKPRNIRITADGVVKVLDFGIATAVGDGAGAVGSPPPEVDPTLTQATLGLGTPPYMSPEQVRGEPLDRRTDIWSFGCVLYEMLTGARAYEAVDTVSTVASILEHEPDLDLLPPGTPPGVRRLLALCLDKDRHTRLAHMTVATFQLEEALASSAAERRPRHRGWRLVARPMVWGLLAGAIGGLGAGWTLARRAMPGLPQPVRLAIAVTPADQLGGIEGWPTRTAFAISPDGRTLVFSAMRGNGRMLYRRQFAEPQAVAIAGTAAAQDPFLSPDGRWVGFWSGGEIRKVAMAGGAPVRVAEAQQMFGASWGDDDRIVYATVGGGLMEVPAAGGAPVRVTSLDAERGEFSHRLPHVLPGGEAILFTITRNRFPRWDQTEIAVYSRRTRTSTVLIEGGAYPVYAATGHLLYVREGALLAAPFDAMTLKLTAGPTALIPDVMQSAYFRGVAYDSGAAQFAVSTNGTLIYLEGGTFLPADRSVLSVDRRGREERLPIDRRPYGSLRLSPDGERLALSTVGRDREIWMYSLPRRTLTRLAVPGRVSFPVWTPDGERITYAGGVGGPDALHLVRADSVGVPELLRREDQNLVPAAWSTDSRQLLYYHLPTGEATRSRRTMIHEVGAGGDPVPVTAMSDRSSLGGTDLSRDGRWLAYQSDASGRLEVYVQAHPDGVPRYQVSTEGGRTPVWRADGQELFYLQPDDRTAPLGSHDMHIMAVAVQTTPTFSLGPPRALFRGRYEIDMPPRAYDVAPDGQRFFLLQAIERPADRFTHLTVVLHWFQELERLTARR